MCHAVQLAVKLLPSAPSAMKGSSTRLMLQGLYAGRPSWSVSPPGIKPRIFRLCKPLDFQALSAFSLSPLSSSFLSLSKLFTHESHLLLSRIRPAVYLFFSVLSRFFFFFLGCWWGNNEAEGTCFLLGLNSPLYQPVTRVWARWCFLKGLQTPAELSHPLSSLLPAAWWVVASWPYCPRSSDKHWKLEGTFQPSTPSSFTPPPPKKKQPMTFSLEQSGANHSFAGLSLSHMSVTKAVSVTANITATLTVWRFQEATTVTITLLPQFGEAFPSSKRKRRNKILIIKVKVQLHRWMK